MKNIINKIITIIIFMLIYYLILYLLDTTCPLKWLTGISCAGCGMSRAYLALLKGDIHLAFHYHPLFWLLPIAFIIYFKRNSIDKRVLNCLICVGIALFVVVYIIRLFNPSDEIVVCNIKESIIYKIITRLKVDLNVL